MKARGTYRNQTFDLVVINLCHYGDHGDYELLPSEELDLDLPALAGTLADHGCEIEGQSQNTLLLHDDRAILTIFQTGRMIIENVSPSTFEHAITIGCRMIQAAGGSFLPR